MTLALVAGLWDVGVTTWLPGPLAAVSFALPFVVLTAIFSKAERSLTVAVISGMILDIYLPSSAGFVTLRYVAIALAVRALTERLLTNRSLAGVLALSAFGVLANRALLLVLESIAGLGAAGFIPEANAPLVAELVWCFAISTMTFMMIAALTKRFLPLVSREQGSLPLWRS